MLIVSIETSCDETAVSLVEAHGDFPNATYEIRGNALYSQIAIHKEYGGVFPALAKREHIKNILPLFTQALREGEALEESPSEVDAQTAENVRTILTREEGLSEELLSFFAAHELPPIDLIAVTTGPGLEPALWVGVNFAKALAALTKAPLVSVNHMEGHILASLFDAVEDDKLADIAFPAVALLISGGHTELVLVRDWIDYEKIGQTKDDAVGEAFDKVARMLGIPYPGGPEVSARAARAREAKLPPFKADLPRPMLHSNDLDFSFSGLKTSVRYAIEGKSLTPEETDALCRDFEDAVTEVLLKKSADALTQHGGRTLIVGGGVSANTYIKKTLTESLLASHPDVEIYFPAPKLSTDNSVMIALAGHAHYESASRAGAIQYVRADGNRSL
jgi:N6-L-threonylcarbamoyladenine synthase